LPDVPSSKCGSEFSCQHRSALLFCGSWLACDTDTSIHQANPAVDPIPAHRLTQYRLKSSPPSARSTQFKMWERVQLPAPQCSAFLWELACLRYRHLGTSVIPSSRPHTSSQIDPVQFKEQPTLCLMYPVPNVGAGLLANAVCQSPTPSTDTPLRLCF
jgi:hypothetical protein